MWDSKTNFWYLGISTFATVCFAGYLNYKINQWLDKRITVIEKTKKNNTLLGFGPSVQQCDGHMNREFDCGNLDCNYGRLSYILGSINNCKKSLDVCIYIFTLKLFGDCIIKAQQRGVIVRVIADSDMSFSAQSLINSFRLTDIPTTQFVIVDNEVLINGSMDFTMTGAFCNWESVMITTQPTLVDAFQNIFDKLWDDLAPVNYSNNDSHVNV